MMRTLFLNVYIFFISTMHTKDDAFKLCYNKSSGTMCKSQAYAATCKLRRAFQK